MNLSHASKSILRAHVEMGNISREYAATLASQRADTYAANPKYANKPQKIDGWRKLAAAFAAAPVSAKPKAKAKVKAKPQAQVAVAPAFTQANVAKFTKATVRELVASRRILTKAEKAGIVEFLSRI